MNIKMWYLAMRRFMWKGILKPRDCHWKRFCFFICWFLSRRMNQFVKRRLNFCVCTSVCQIICMMFLVPTQTSLGCSELDVIFSKINTHPIHCTDFPLLEMQDSRKKGDILQELRLIRLKTSEPRCGPWSWRDDQCSFGGRPGRAWSLLGGECFLAACEAAFFLQRSALPPFFPFESSFHMQGCDSAWRTGAFLLSLLTALTTRQNAWCGPFWKWMIALRPNWRHLTRTTLMVTDGPWRRATFFPLYFFLS